MTVWLAPPVKRNQRGSQSVGTHKRYVQTASPANHTAHSARDEFRILFV
jgi:hypothetical protein